MKKTPQGNFPCGGLYHKVSTTAFRGYDPGAFFCGCSRLFASFLRWKWVFLLTVLEYSFFLNWVWPEHEHSVNSYSAQKRVAFADWIWYNAHNEYAHLQENGEDSGSAIAVPAAAPA